MIADASTSASPNGAPHHQQIGLRHPDSAIRDWRSHLLLWSVAAAGLVADLWSKSWAFSTLVPGETRPWIGNVLDFQLSRNPGALFGMGPGMVPLFIIASILALAFVIYMFAGVSRKHRLIHIALALVLAGALGNLFDRTFEQYDMAEIRTADGKTTVRLLGQVIGEPNEDTVELASWTEGGRVRTFDRADIVGPIRRVGVVRDFLKIVWRIGGRELWPWVFNVADVLLVVGVGLLLIGFWRHPASPAERGDAGEPASQSG